MAFLDRSLANIVSPGDSVVIVTPGNKRKRAFVNRVFMQQNEDGTYTPSCEISYKGDDGYPARVQIPTERTIRIEKYMGDEYVSVAALDYAHMPAPGANVMVWSNKLHKMILACVLAIDDDVSLIKYKNVQYEVPTSNVHIHVRSRAKEIL